MSKICLCLTAKTIAQDLEILEKYRSYIDIVELRVDHLLSDEQFYVRKFPSLAGIPVILTIRRKEDGGLFSRGESARIVMLSNALAYAEADRRNNFAYIDLEEDLDVPSLEEAARAFGTRIIRSFHSFDRNDENLFNHLVSLKRVGDEIVKAAVLPNSLDDVAYIFNTAKKLKDTEKILLCMGDAGVCTRILANKIDSYITYTSVKNEAGLALAAPGQTDTKELAELYHFRKIKNDTAVFGITGYPLKVTSSPLFHNNAYNTENINAVYVPFPAKDIKSFFNLADTIGLKGASVTVPHKESVVQFLTGMTDDVRKIGACNTILRTSSGWHGFNTDTLGFSGSLLSFIGQKDFRWTKVTVVGAGGASRAIVYELWRLKAKVLIVNRNGPRAMQLAETYKFDWCTPDEEGCRRIKKYSDIIIQTTPVGMEDDPNDPLAVYRFSGNEIVMDIIYKPERTPFLTRAAAAGCRVLNGADMFLRQARLQHEIFTGGMK
ncbi:3-dehydroquinate dehydratase [Spirochaetia bacterium]|nr:3-dehydroquinate dehydratase [Spirochaetia bacterium]